VDSGVDATDASDASAMDAGGLDPSVCVPPDAEASDAGCAPTPPTAEPQVLAGEVSRVTATCGVCGQPPPLVGPVPDSTTIEFGIELPLRNGQQLTYCLGPDDVPLHYLTPDQFTELYGPTECDYASLIAWVESHGLAVDETFSDRSLLLVGGTAAAIGAALHVRFNYYLRPDGTQFFAPDRDPSLDSAIPVDLVVGLDNCNVAMPVSEP
jgi:hypothetical protein